MAKFVSLINWTQEGIKAYKETVDRYESAKGLLEQAGGSISIWYTLGPYDAVAVVEAPNDETGAAILLRLGSQGFVKTTTMRAFGPDEMRGIIAKNA